MHFTKDVLPPCSCPPGTCCMKPDTHHVLPCAPPPPPLLFFLGAERCRLHLHGAAPCLPVDTRHQCRGLGKNWRIKGSREVVRSLIWSSPALSLLPALAFCGVSWKDSPQLSLKESALRLMRRPGERDNKGWRSGGG